MNQSQTYSWIIDQPSTGVQEYIVEFCFSFLNHQFGADKTLGYAFSKHTQTYLSEAKQLSFPILLLRL